MSSEGHVDGVRKRLTWFLEETKITRLSRLRPSLVDTALKTLRDAGKSDRQGVALLRGPETRPSRWAKKDRPTRIFWHSGKVSKIVTENKRAAYLRNRARPAGHHDPGRKSPAQDDQEKNGAGCCAWRSITGLRRSELQSLTPGPVATWTPLRPTSPFPAATPRIATMPSSPFPPMSFRPCGLGWQPSPGRTTLPEDRNSALMIRADLKAAGIPSDTYDFHGLRHC